MLTTINVLFTFIPAGLFIAMVALLAIYKLNSRTADTIARELAQKRASGAGQVQQPTFHSATQE